MPSSLSSGHRHVQLVLASATDGHRCALLEEASRNDSADPFVAGRDQGQLAAQFQVHEAVPPSGGDVTSK